MKIDASWYKKPDDIPEYDSAGGVVVRIEKNKLLIAFIRDPQYEGYVLPKGRVEGKESLEETAKREIAEETGLNNLKLITKLGVKERLTFVKNEWKKIHYFLFLTDQESGTQNLQEKENYVLEWFDIDDLPSIFWPEQKELIEENKEKIIKLARKG